MQTLKSSAAWFLAHCSDHRKLSPHTLKAYRRDLDHFCLFAFNGEADLPIHSVGRDLVRKWLGTMVTVKPRTIRRRLATIKSMFSSLERDSNATDNPLAGLRSQVKVGISLPRTIARTAVKSLLRSTRKQPTKTPRSIRRVLSDTTIVEMLFATGMRVSEVV